MASTGKRTRVESTQSVSRRTLARAAAWSTPVVAMSVAAPAVAASGCPTLPYPYSLSVTGSVATNDNDRYETRPDNVNRFRSAADALSGTVVKTLTTSFVSAAGQKYSFAVTAWANFGNFDQSGSAGQRVEVIVGGTVVLRLSTRQLSGYTTMATGNSTSAPTVTSYSFTWTAPSTATVSYQLRFTETAFTSGQGNDDINISAPTITCS